MVVETNIVTPAKHHSTMEGTILLGLGIHAIPHPIRAIITEAMIGQISMFT
jgi:hypothetical protein